MTCYSRDGGVLSIWKKGSCYSPPSSFLLFYSQRTFDMSLWSNLVLFLLVPFLWVHFGQFRDHRKSTVVKDLSAICSFSCMFSSTLFTLLFLPVDLTFKYIHT